MSRPREYTPMPTVAIPLQDLAQRIQQQQAELAKPYKELESRNAHLAKLTRRKEELRTQLQQIETEIQMVEQTGRQAPSAAPAHTTQKKPAAAAPLAKPGQGISLPKLLVSIIQE